MAYYIRSFTVIFERDATTATVWPKSTRC